MIRRLFATSAVDVYVLVVGMVSLTITARLLGPEGRGLFVVGTSLGALFGSLASMSVDRVLVFRGVAAGTPDWQELFAELLLFWVIVVLATPLALLPLYLVAGEYLFPAVGMALYLTVLFLSVLVVWQQLLQAMLVVIDEIEVFNRSKVVGATATGLLVIGFVAWLDGGVLGAIWGVVAGRVIELGWALFGVKAHLGFPRRSNLSGAIGLVSHGLKLHINTLGNVVRSNADVLMLNALLGPAAAGLFQLSTKLIDFMLIVPSAAARLFQGRIVAKGPRRYWREQKRAMGLIALFLLGAAILAFVATPFLVPLVFGVEFSVSANYFQWLLPIVFGKAYGVMMATQAVSRGYLWVSSALGIGAAALNVVLNAILIPSYGIAGAVGASLTCFGLVPFVVNTLFFMHYERVER